MEMNGRTGLSAMPERPAGQAEPGNACERDEIIRVEKLGVELPTGTTTSVQAVRNASLTVRRRERIGIVGESGSGKSITGRTIAGLLPESRRVRVSGSVKIHGREMVGASKQDWQKVRRETVSMIFQDPLSFLNPTMAVGRQVAEACRGDGWRNRQEGALSYLALAGLPAPQETARRFPFELSGGMRQRVLIAIALAKRPDLIIADEPTTALDVTVQAKVLEALDDSVTKLQSSLIMISHDLAVVAKLCERIYVMHMGQVVESGPTLEVLTEPRHDYTRHLLAGVRNLTSLDEDLSGFKSSIQA
jgi:ABC-type dipeptide/oligopeptide/nickel transport system ATPase component